MSTPRSDRGRVVAASDCERCRPGLVTQPVNTISSLGFVLAGALVVAAGRRDGRHRPGAAGPVGRAMAMAGLGSVAYHGPGTAFGRWLHDATLLNLAATIAVTDLAGPPPPVDDRRDGRGSAAGRRAALAGVAAGSAVLAHPRTTTAAQAGTAGLATLLEVRRFSTRGPAPAPDRRRGLVAAVLAGAGLALQVNGRTGRGWCRPDSRLQAHAGWHLLSAAALWARNT